MGKHGKSKSGNRAAGAQARPTPYTKKPRVEVTYEGGAKDSRPPASASSSAIPATTKAVAAGEASSSSKAKGKAKAVDSTTAPSIDTDVKPEIIPPDDLPPFLVIAGSYEKLLYGLQGSFGPSASEDDQPEVTLEPTFIFPAHLACVKAIAASPGGKWLATGSEDEFVKVWDLRRKKEVGSLSQHSGSITSLHFPTSSHLISTSVDGTLALFRTSDWALLKSLKGHSGRVNHVDVHPTGRVALSVGKDATLRMWDLMRGRGAASLALGTEAEMVKFSPLGTHFAVLFPKKIEIYSLTLKLLHTLTGPSRFNALLFARLPSDDGEVETEDKEVLCVGTEKGVVEVYEVELAEEPMVQDEDAEEDEDHEAGSSSKQSSAKVERIATLVGHTNRRIHQHLRPRLGPIAISLRRGDEQPQLRPVGSYDTKGSRLTCVFLAEGRAKANGKGKSQGVTGQSGAVGNGKQVKLEDVRKEEVFEELEGSDEEEDEAGNDNEDEDEDMYEQDEASEGEGEDGVEVEFEDEEGDEEEEEDEEEMEE